MRAPVALVAIGLLAGCSTESTTKASSAQPTTLLPTVTAQAPSPTTTPTASASRLPSSDFGYFPAVLSAGPPITLSFDRAEFLTGAAADKAAAADGQQTPVPNDYYVVNRNTLRRRLTLSPDVKVLGSLRLNGFAGQDSVVDLRPRTVKELLGFLRTSTGAEVGFHLKYSPSGAVVRIEEQFVP